MERLGLLPDGVPYAIQYPDEWNGILLADKDGLGIEGGYGPYSTAKRAWLRAGFALAGTHRVPTPRHLGDVLTNQVRVIEIAAAEMGDARHVFQVGGSGGGMIALAMAEQHADRIDGALATCASYSILDGNLTLDLAAALAALLDPGGDLALAGFGQSEWPQLRERWTTVLEDARGSALGRARIALASAVAQWPIAGGVHASAPDPDLPADEVMIRAAVDGAIAMIGIRPILDTPAGVMSWNEGVEVPVDFESETDRAAREIVRGLYDRVGGGRALDADLDRLTAVPRVRAEPSAVEYWAPVSAVGRPRVPVVDLTSADLLSPSISQGGYGARVRALGDAEMYRQVFVGAFGHCNLTVAELTLALELLLARVESGRWGDGANADVLAAAAAARWPEGSEAADGTIRDACFIDLRPSVPRRALLPDHP